MLTRSQQRHTVAACFLSWTLDAFDFFIMVFVLADIAKEFGTGMTAVTIAITLTLAARPLGALLFGYMADSIGRRLVLIINVLTFTVFEFASGLAPSLVAFIIIRALFGVAMGGEWGVGASLTMESIPAKWRGAASGLLQAGYPCGYLLASLLYWVAFSAVGWRMLFIIGAVPGLFVAALYFLVREGIAGLAATQGRSQNRHVAGDQGQSAADDLCHSHHDRDQLLRPRHARPLSERLSARAARFFCFHGVEDCDRLFDQAQYLAASWSRAYRRRSDGAARSSDPRCCPSLSFRSGRFPMTRSILASAPSSCSFWCRAASVSFRPTSTSCRRPRSAERSRASSISSAISWLRAMRRSSR